MIHRRTTPEGALRLRTPGCTYTIIQLRPGALLCTIAGKEKGEMGRALLGEVAAETALHPPVELFFDFSALTLVAENISNDWTAWFRTNKAAIRHVHVLVPSPIVRLTVAVSEIFSRVSMQIYTEAEKFDKAIHLVSPSTDRLKISSGEN